MTDATSATQESAIGDFLKRCGWENATREKLGIDASTRRYERLVMDEYRAILMIAPSEDVICLPEHTEADRDALGWNAQSRLAASRVEAFVAVDEYLRSIGLSAPYVFDVDVGQGLALLEDLGDSLFARAIDQGEDEVALYTQAAEVLAIVHTSNPPRILSTDQHDWPLLDYDALALRVNADLFFDWSQKQDPSIEMDNVSRAEWEIARDALIQEAMSFPRSMILRDYHAENLVWLPDRDGAQRVGLLDFQDAVIGWPEWDFAMLLQDARRDVSPEAAEAAIKTYLEKTGGDRNAFDAHLAVLGTLNALRVAGVFSRLIQRDQKPKYLDFLPRQLKILGENLKHPAVAPMREIMSRVAPHLLGDIEVQNAPVATTPGPFKTAMLMAAGKGTRMRPITDSRPKPLVEVAGRSLIDRLLDKLVANGVERAVVNVHYLADMLESHVLQRTDIEVLISDERGELLETGGGVVKASSLLGTDPVYIINTDSCWADEHDSTLADMSRWFDPDKMDALLLLARKDHSMGFDGAGDFFLHKDGRLERRGDYAEAPFAYAGVYIMNPSLVANMSVEPFSANAYWNEFLANDRLYGCVMKPFWMHVGDPNARHEAEIRLNALET